MLLVALVVLVGLPRLLALNEKRVSFDQFIQLVDKGQLRKVSFQVDTILGESGSDDEAGAAGSANKEAATPAAGSTSAVAPAPANAAVPATPATATPGTAGPAAPGARAFPEKVGCHRRT